MSEESKPEEAPQEEVKINPNAFYIEAIDVETKEKIVLEAPPKLPSVVRDLKATMMKYGESFCNQIITIVGYHPVADPETKTMGLQRFELAKGQPVAVIKQLEDQCMDKGVLANEMLRVLGVMARNSGLKAVNITYLVEEPDGDVLTGGNTMLFVGHDEVTDGELSQLYNSVKSHADQLKEQMEAEGRTVVDQDGPKLLTPGDAGFVMPPKKS